MTAETLARPELAPDAAPCAACAAEIVDPYAPRFRDAFARCAECGPRFSLGPETPSAAARPRLVRCAGGAVTFETFSMLDDADAVCTLLQRGHVVALKGPGSYQLVCDATNAAAVARLRAAKGSGAKPFAVMARDLDVIRRFCAVGIEEERALAGPAAPIVVLRAAGARLPDEVAPGRETLGVMLPPTPLHLLVLRRMSRPVVVSSANLAGAPPIVDDAEARERLGALAEFALVHGRPIPARLDDSVVRVIDGAPRVLRRGRGFVPAALTLPAGFAASPDVFACGADREAAFCLTRSGRAVLSPPGGDLADAASREEYRRSVARFAGLYAHAPRALAGDGAATSHAGRFGRERARELGLPFIEVGVRHAHVAASLAENGRPLAAGPVIGIVLDGPCRVDDEQVSAGELLLADYRHARRLAAWSWDEVTDDDVACTLATIATRIARDDRAGTRIDAIALAGSRFADDRLLEATARRIREAGFRVLLHALVPPGAGGLALGQAAIAAARCV